MFKTITDPADCEIPAVIRFLNARNVKPAEIYRQVEEVYGKDAMSDGMVRKGVSCEVTKKVTNDSVLKMNSTNKRKNDDKDGCGSSSGPKKSFKGHWSQGLHQSMNDPDLLVEKDEKIVIIKDKYPKAKYHFLVLPQENIPDLKSLTASHLQLLKYIHKKGENLAARFPSSEFRLGYHAVPSMSQVHLHVISQDFNSPCLKTKKHWNSFTTSYFIDSDKLIQELKEEENIKSLIEVNGKELLSEPLKCHKCDFVPKNMPNLKEHLLKHMK